MQVKKAVSKTEPRGEWRSKPKLRQYIAARAIYHYFSEDDFTEGEQREILAYCSQHMSGDNQARFMLRLLTEVNNDKIVDCVLKEANETERQFIYCRYKQGMSRVNMSMKLNAHHNSLYYWHEHLLEKIFSMMFFKLPKSEAFSIRSVETITEILGETLDFLQSHCQGMVRQPTMSELSKRYKVYARAGHALRRYSECQPQNTQGRVIKAKLDEPSASIESLARMLRLSTGTVCEHLTAFTSKYYGKQDEKVIKMIAG